MSLHLPHLVNRIILEINVHSNDRSFVNNAQSNLYNFLKRSISESISKIFDKYSKTSEPIRLEKMVLDLGELEAEGSYKEFVERLLHQLDKALRFNIEQHRFTVHEQEAVESLARKNHTMNPSRHSYSESTSVEETDISYQKTQKGNYSSNAISMRNNEALYSTGNKDALVLRYFYDTLIHFIERGLFPWWFNEKSVQDYLGLHRRATVDDILAFLSNRAPMLIFNALETHVGNPLCLDRIVRQISFSNLYSYLKNLPFRNIDSKRCFLSIIETFPKVRLRYLNSHEEKLLLKSTIRTASVLQRESFEGDELLDTLFYFLSGYENNERLSDIRELLYAEMKTELLSDSYETKDPPWKINDFYETEKRLVRHAYTTLLRSILLYFANLKPPGRRDLLVEDKCCPDSYKMVSDIYKMVYESLSEWNTASDRLRKHVDSVKQMCFNELLTESISIGLDLLVDVSDKHIFYNYVNIEDCQYELFISDLDRSNIENNNNSISNRIYLTWIEALFDSPVAALEMSMGIIDMLLKNSGRDQCIKYLETNKLLGKNTEKLSFPIKDSQGTLSQSSPSKNSKESSVSEENEIEKEDIRNTARQTTVVIEEDKSRINTIRNTFAANGKRPKPSAIRFFDLMWSETKKREIILQIVNAYNSKSMPEYSPGYNVNKLNEMYINNAGVVIILPFLTSLFERLGFVNGDGFVNDVRRKEAIMIIQYIVTGAEKCYENDIPFNKILCDFPLEEPVDTNIDIVKSKFEICDELVDHVIARWSALKTITPDGFRKTFLQRDGILRNRNGAWMVHIEKESFDVLLDRLPWAISIIRLPWLKSLIYVDW